MKKLLCLLILMVSPMLASANDGDTFSEETVEGVLLNYTIISESEKTCMVGYKKYPDVPTARNRRGPEENVSQVSGDITIPEEAKGYRVVQIETSAFEQTAITGVFIPNSVKTIGSYAFQMCVDLKSVRLSEQLTRIAGYTFYGCKSLTSIDIPEGVTSIGDYAFAGCEQLKDINIPSGVEQFGGNVFCNTGFTSLPKLPESLTVIPKGMFYECTQLTSIEIPENITMIDECAFGRCPISEIEIPASVTHVGVAAFANCKNITDLTIPDNVTEIGFNAFNGCSNLKTVKLSNNITSLNQGVFNECSSLESVIIPNGVKSIGKFAFEGCSSLGSINLPETLEEIGEQAFFGCSSLKQLFIPKNFVRFKKDENNTYWSFIYGCTSLTSVVVDEDNPVFDSRDNCNAIIETASNTLVAGCITTKIPEGITVIGSWAFGGFHDLTSITLPHSLNRIEQSAFNGSGLREITLPENVTYIGAYAFSSCNSLKDFYCCAEKVLEAENSAFGNTNLKEVTLHVPAASVSAYQATKPWKNFKEIVALSPQDSNTNGFDYLPFVKAGKKWNVIRFDFDRGYHHEYYKLMNEKVEKAGKTYMKMYRSEDDLDVVYDTGLFREEDRKVYFFDDAMQKEYLMFDFSLQAGDTYETYSYNDQKMVSYKVLSVDNYTEGPEVIRYEYDEKGDSMVTHHRLLQKWTVRRMDNNLEKTWIEGAGSLEGPLGNLQDVVLPGLTKDYLAYVEYKGKPYLPFSFYDTMNKQIHGSNMPTGVADNMENEDWHHRLTYELEGDRLHVYGKVFCGCGGNHYAYFSEESTDDPMVRKIHFEIQNANPELALACQAHHPTNFYVPGFDPNLSYIVVDNQREEHPVINKTPQMAYRPLVEEGKHWTYDNYMPLRPEKYDHYYYYDLKGDTLIAGLHCLKMYSENSYNNNAICYEGALYEVNKKVYCFFPEKNQAELLYDFDCTVGDTIQVREGQLAVKDIRTEDNGGIAIRKYILMPVVAAENYMGEIFWIEGVGASKDFFGMLPLLGNYNTLNACELNGEKLYQTIESDYTEAGYHKMAIEGKRWNYIHYHLENDGWHEEPYSYVVKGDTIIRRTTYKKLYYQDAKTERFACLLLERGRTVYKNTDFGNNSYDSPVLTTFFEFDREDFGRVFTWKAKNNSGNTNWMVYGVDTVEVNNRQFRRYTCLQKYSEESETLTTIKYDGEGVWHDIWVEGVGSASRGIEDQYPSHEPQERKPGDYTTFVSCYENGECIFTADDFNIQTTTKSDEDMDYRPFVEEGKVWKVGCGSQRNPVQLFVEYYYFDGDTIIDGKTCKQMMCQRYVNPDYPDYAFILRYPLLQYKGAWYEEDKKVYFWDSTRHRFKLRYDFSVNANDTLQIEYDYYPYVLGPKQTGGLKGFKGVYRDVMMSAFGVNSYNTTWLEGVGGIDGPIVSHYLGEENHVGFLMSCTVGDEVIYLNDEYEDGATPEAAGARKNHFDFSHTIKTKPKAPRRSSEESSLYGEYNDQRLGINLNPLDDAYLVRITDESGKVVYEKAVNAGNIVGLNVDISAYEKGRYTVTVENSNEAFTGQFDAQITGIKTITNNKVETRPSIYNLHGQRLSSLQKGLNIVNGQKIFVK